MAFLTTIVDCAQLNTTSNTADDGRSPSRAKNGYKPCPQHQGTDAEMTPLQSKHNTTQSQNQEKGKQAEQKGEMENI